MFESKGSIKVISVISKESIILSVQSLPSQLPVKSMSLLIKTWIETATEIGIGTGSETWTDGMDWGCVSPWDPSP